MAELNDAPVYHGHPKNQRNPKAINAFRGKQASQDSNAEPVKPRAAAARKPHPPKLNAPTRLHDASSQVIDNSDPFKASAFVHSLSQNEDRPRARFTPSFATATDLSRRIFSELMTDDKQLNKVLTPEMIDYYVTCLIWLRIVNIKNKNHDPLTDEEIRLVAISEDVALNIPEPIRLYLLTFGNLTTAIGTHLRPRFPPLPTGLRDFNNNNTPGFHDNNEITLANHNLYEEVPTTGVALCALITATNNRAGQWDPPIIPANYVATYNLLNYRPTANYRPEAISHIVEHGITEDDPVESYPQNTGFIIEFLKWISDQLASTKTFKVTSTIMSRLSEYGSQAQLAEVHPLDGQPGQRTATGEVVVKTINPESLTTIGTAIAFSPRLYKDAPYDAQNCLNWSCTVPQNPALAVPRNWYNNRNARRETPTVYHDTQWTSISKIGSEYRRLVIQSFILTPR
nr:MAG: hypothetical protein [brine shrimp partiti-like virus 2]